MRSGSELWELNVMSYVRAIRAVLPRCSAGERSDRNVSSSAGKRPSTGMPELLGHEGGRLLAVAARRGPLLDGRASAATP